LALLKELEREREAEMLLGCFFLVEVSFALIDKFLSCENPARPETLEAEEEGVLEAAFLLSSRVGGGGDRMSTKRIINGALDNNLNPTLSPSFLLALLYANVVLSGTDMPCFGRGVFGLGLDADTGLLFVRFS
jgi:hypothetical protein